MAGGARPSVAVVVVNLDGKAMLPGCLDSLLDQDYDGDTAVVVVDNGSRDGSLDLLADRYPQVRVLPQGRNTGFAPAVDIGARAVDADCVALVNNDMRVDRGWLRALVDHLDVDAGVVCVGGLILSDDGQTVDFAEGSLAFNGMGDQVGFGTPVADLAVDDGVDLLFACGGSMLVDRRTFLEVGGFDEEFFAYFEDVDFGWRLQVLGLRTVLAREARSFHQHHGTVGRFPRYQREFLVERNALAAAVKNYDDEHLAEVLGPSLLLLAKRSVLKGGLDRGAYDIGGSSVEEEKVGRDVLVGLMAMADLLDGIDGWMARREVVQASRRRSDAEILDRFVHPLRPAIAHPAYNVAQRTALRAFGLDDRFQHERTASVAAVGAAADALGPTWDVEIRRLPAASAWAVEGQAADVLVVPVSLLADGPDLGTWPVVVGVVVTDEDRAVDPAGVAADLVLEPDEVDHLRDVIARPWRWRRQRRADRWAGAAGEDVQKWIASLVEAAETERSLRASEALRHATTVAELKVALDRRRHEVAALKERQVELEASLAEHERRFAALKPLMPVLRLAAKARRSISTRLRHSQMPQPR